MSKESWFKVEEKTVRRLRKIREEKEKKIFLSLCSEIDENKVLGKQPMTLEDFERIHYLISELGLDAFAIYFAMENDHLLKVLANKIENELVNGSVRIHEELTRRDKWIEEFVSQLPSQKTKKYIAEILRG